MSEKIFSLLSGRNKGSAYAIYAGIAAIAVFCIWRVIHIYTGIASAAISAGAGWIRMILLVVAGAAAVWILLYASRQIRQKKKPVLFHRNSDSGYKPPKGSRKSAEDSDSAKDSAAVKEQDELKEPSSEHLKVPNHEETTEMTGMKTSDSPVETPELPKLTPAFQENNCCICNGSLEDGYSILFKANNGAEARIDKKCRSALRALSKCEDTEEVLNAGRYLSSYYLSVAPIVLPHLDSFLQKGSDYLRESKKKSQSENEA